MLVSAVKQSEFTACIGTPPPTPIPPFLVNAGLRARLPPTAPPHQLSALHAAVYTRRCHALSSPHSLPSPRLHVCSPHLHLYFCPARNFIGTIFSRFSLCACVFCFDSLYSFLAVLSFPEAFSSCRGLLFVVVRWLLSAAASPAAAHGQMPR